MSRATQTTIPCAQCRQQIRVTVQSVIDAQQDPQAKVSLLSGALNATRCPNCGAPNTVLTPLLYHDSAKEMLISYVPIELGLSKDGQEKAIGELMQDLTRSLPQGAFKAYMLQPRQALTMQGFLEQVLHAEGVTPEMMQTQRDRVRLVQTFLQTPEEQIQELVAQNDARLDAQFFQTFSLIVQQLAADGQTDLAEHALAMQSQLVQMSSYGQQVLEQTRQQEEIIDAVATELNALGEDATQGDILDLVIRYADDAQRLQALVGLIRPVFDYAFFQELTLRIGQAPASERDRLEAMRERLLTFTSLVDQQAQMAFQEAASLLREILTSHDPDEAIRQNLPLLDNTFLQILTANIQEAQRRSDLKASARLKDVYQRVISALQANMPPELQFINDLLSAESDDAARTLISGRAVEFGPSLLEAVDMVSDQLAAGHANPVVMARLEMIRRELEQAVG